MKLKCMRPSCNRAFVGVEGMLTGALAPGAKVEITLICPKCTGRSTYTFRPENMLQPGRKFSEKAREGESQSELHRTDLRTSAPACDQRETPAASVPAQSIARTSRSAV